MRTFLLILGLVLLALGAQGAIRLLLDHDNVGMLGWVPGGFPVQLLGYLAAAAVGIVLAAVNARSSGKPPRPSSAGRPAG